MAQGKSWSLAKTDPALVLGLITSGIYYSIVLQPAMRETMLAKYTAEHSVEYVIVTLFFWGIIDIIFKLMSFPREYLATRHDWLPHRMGREPASRARELLDQVRSSPAWMLKSSIGRRLTEALGFVAERNSADDYREHLEHLADQDNQELHAKYTVLRFVIAVTPILGFLGTVVHFGAAIGGFSFKDMDAKLPEIVSGMGTAFNTTSVALATAMTMMFALFLCERVDHSIMASIDRLIDSELLHRFESKDPSITPFLSLIQSANRESMDAINRSLADQAHVWTAGLDKLFEHFQERQRLELMNSAAAFDAIRKRHEEYESARESQFSQLISRIDAQQDQQLQNIQTALQSAMVFREDIARLMQTLNAIAIGEGHLVELQSVLAQNLRAIHETGQIDAALHELTAAIHLLTSRGRQLGRSDSAAA